MTWAKGTINREPAQQPVHVDIGAQRAVEIAAQYGTTHVVLSFGSRGGGAYFARWLRWTIMQRRGYSQPNNIYLDTVALAEVPDTAIRLVDARRPWLCGLASMNGGWRAYYRNAIMQADTMIFVGTAEWCNSPWCLGEYEYFLYDQRQRASDGRPPLNGIALIFPDSSELFPGLNAIRAEKQRVDPRYDDYWHIDGMTQQRLMSLVG